MAYPVDAQQARAVLAGALQAAETAVLAGVPPEVPADIAAATERLFTSATQAYREALAGCAVARCVDPRIDIRHPATETSAHAFSGRSLADQVVTPFLQEHAFPISKSPYLSALRGGARFEPGGAPRIQRDQAGFDALVYVVAHLARAPVAAAQDYLVFLLHRFVLLREAGRIELRRIARPPLRQLVRLIAALTAARSGGRLAALLATAMFQTLSDCHALAWEVEWQGINVADAASGAVGDIAIRHEGVLVPGVEVTERTVDRGRVAAIFEHKVAPNGLADYLFITTVPPEAAAVAVADNFTAVGHEINFVQLQPWLEHLLATLGPRGRAQFQARMLARLAAQNADLKVLWNASMDAAIAG